VDKVKKFKSAKLKKGLKIAGGVALGAAALGGAYAIGRRLSKTRKGSRNNTIKLRGQVRRLALKVEKAKLERRLIREQMKAI